MGLLFTLEAGVGEGYYMSHFNIFMYTLKSMWSDRVIFRVAAMVSRVTVSRL